jgi:hypothetical protein
MHPLGLQFGLARGLLHGEDVLVSDQLLETISAEAHLYISLLKPQSNFECKNS